MPAAVTSPIAFSKPSSASGIVCGDVLESLRAIRGGGIFDLVIADPPYNIGKDFGNNIDSRGMNEYLAWSTAWIGECLRLVKESQPVFVYGFPEVLAHIAVRYPMDKQRWLIWHYTNKTVPQLKFWQRSHEAILCLWRGRRPQVNVDEVRVPYGENYLRCAGRVRRETKCRYSNKGRRTVYNAHPRGALPRDVLRVPALAGGAGRAERWFLCKTCGGTVHEPGALREHDGHEIIKHPTQKPSVLTRQLIQSAINGGGGRLLVPFSGSGSECVVARSMGVDYRGIEINPEYVALAEGWLAHERVR